MSTGNEEQRSTLLMVLVFAVIGGCTSSKNTSLQAAGIQGDGVSIQSIRVAGKETFADGTPIASRDVQYQVILDGANLFQAGIAGCLPTPAHVAGTSTQNSATGALGQFALSVPVGSINAAVVRQCTIQLLRPSQIEGLTLRASILADGTTCPAYCSAQGDPSQNCVQDCATGNRTIDASQAVSLDQLQPLLQKISNGALNWGPNLTFDSLGPALGTGSLPDLLVDGAAAKASAHASRETFAESSCEVAEQCVRAPGTRTVLRFDGTIQNLGDADLVIGAPESSALFTQSACHNVALLKNIMLYELLDPTTGAVVQVENQDVIGRKQGFCMMDITQLNATSPQGQYNCDNQGITRGWADVYDADLECQFLDVTGVPPGGYTLRLTVNPDGLFSESNTTNNSVELPVSIPAI